MRRDRGARLSCSAEMPSLLTELKKRRVYRAAAAYAGMAAALLGLAATVVQTFHAPEWILQPLILFAAVGFPFVVVGSWLFDVRGRRLERTLEPPGAQKGNHTRVLIVGLTAGAFAAAIFLLWNWFSNREITFPLETVGVVVLRISGDDTSHSLQRDLISSLNTALMKRPEMSKVKVRASFTGVSETTDPDEAVGTAVQVGRRLNATLVVWGEKIQEHKFHPRLTLVAVNPLVTEMVRHGVRAEALHPGLSEEFVDRPIALLEIIQGMQFLLNEDYKNATLHLDAALSGAGVAQEEMPGIQTLAAHAYLARALAADERAQSLDRAIDLLERSAASPTATCAEASNSWAGVSRCYGLKKTGRISDTRQRRLSAANKAISLALKCNQRITRLSAMLNRAEIYFDWDAAGIPKVLAESQAIISELNNAQSFEEKLILSSAHFYRAIALLHIKPTSKANIDKASAAIEEGQCVRPAGPNGQAAVKQIVGMLHMKRMQSVDDADGEAALSAFEESKGLALAHDSSDVYAKCCFNLGNFFVENARDEKDLDSAVAEFTESARNYDSAEFPQDWALAKFYLGVTQFLYDTNREAHVRTGIGMVNEVLENPNEAISEDLRTAAHSTLGLLCLDTTHGERRELLQSAADHFQWALEHGDDVSKEEYRLYLDEARRRLRALRR